MLHLAGLAGLAGLAVLAGLSGLADLTALLFFFSPAELLLLLFSVAFQASPSPERVRPDCLHRLAIVSLLAGVPLGTKLTPALLCPTDGLPFFTLTLALVLSPSSVLFPALFYFSFSLCR